MEKRINISKTAPQAYKAMLGLDLSGPVRDFKNNQRTH